MLPLTGGGRAVDVVELGPVPCDAADVVAVGIEKPVPVVPAVGDAVPEAVVAPDPLV